jgi:hypothetical protein
MRTNPWEWAVRSSVAAAAATLVLVPMAVLLLLVHGNLWRIGVVTAPWSLSALLLVAVSPLAAVPGCVTAYVADQDRRSRRLAAAASLVAGLAGGLLFTTSPVGLWAGMVLGALGVVAWQERAARRVTSVPASARTEGAWTAVVVEEPGTLADLPRGRLVPRDALAPPEGWDVPLTLPDRSATRADQPAEPAGR